MPFFDFPKGRTVKLTVEQATDVILRCKKRCQDAQFAEKYDVSLSCIRGIRLKRTWLWLRERLETGWRP